MSEDEYQLTPHIENEELYALLGKFMVSFQSFCFELELGIYLMTKFSGQGSGLAVRALTAEMTAFPLLKSFNSIARGMRELSSFENAVISKIYDRATDLIEKRNKFIHAQWFMSEPNEDGVSTFPSPGFQSKNTKKHGMQRVALAVTREDFQPLIAECEALCTLIVRQTLCFAPRNDFSKNFVIDDQGRLSILPADLPDFDWLETMNSK